MYKGFVPVKAANGDIIASPRLPEVEARLRIIRRLYVDHRFSVRDIARYLQLHYATVGRRIKELGLSRSKSDALVVAWDRGNLEHYRSTKTRRRTRT